MERLFERKLATFNALRDEVERLRVSELLRYGHLEHLKPVELSVRRLGSELHVMNQLRKRGETNCRVDSQGNMRLANNPIEPLLTAMRGS